MTVTKPACGDTCPCFPGKRYEDCPLTDPAGQPLRVVRQVWDDIRDRVQTLRDQLVGDWEQRNAVARCCAASP